MIFVRPRTTRFGSMKGSHFKHALWLLVTVGLFVLGSQRARRSGGQGEDSAGAAEANRSAIGRSSGGGSATGLGSSAASGGMELGEDGWTPEEVAKLLERGELTPFRDADGNLSFDET